MSDAAGDGVGAVEGCWLGVGLTAAEEDEHAALNSTRARTSIRFTIPRKSPVIWNAQLLQGLHRRPNLS